MVSRFRQRNLGPLCEIALRRIDTQDSVRLHATSDVSASSQSDAILSDSKKWARSRRQRKDQRLYKPRDVINEYFSPPPLPRPVDSYEFRGPSRRLLLGQVFRGGRDRGLGEEAAKKLPAFHLERNPRLEYFLTLFERPTFTRRRPAPKGENGKICIECRVEKPKGDFNQGLADCKVCESAREKAYRQTVWGSLRRKSETRAQHDKAKDAIMRKDGIDNFLDGTPIYPEYIGELVKRQKGLCAYWNGAQNFEDVRSWSIEKIDNNRRVTSSGTSVSWTRAFSHRTILGCARRASARGRRSGRARNSFSPLSSGKSLHRSPSTWKSLRFKRRRIDREYDDKGNLKCLDCGNSWDPNHSQDRRSCRVCHAIADRAREETLETFLARRLSNAIKRTTEHNAKAKMTPN